MEKKYPINFQENANNIVISFNQNKFATKHLDLFANLFNIFLKKRKDFIFNLSTLTWIAHEELVYLSGIFDQLYNNNIKFRIILKHENPSIRQIKTVIYLWENWQIFSFLSKQEVLENINRYFDLTNINSDEVKEILKKFFEKSENEIDEFIDSIKVRLIDEKSKKFDIDYYFDIDINYVLQLKNNLSEIEYVDFENYYHKITPFVRLNVPNGSFDEIAISNNLKKIYNLDELTYELLEKHSSNTPFLNKTLSSIITKELYENAIEHAYFGKKIKHPACYFSVSLKNKIYEDGQLDYDGIDEINAKNFREESIAESKNFYFGKNGFKNQSILQFTFLDFGLGIPYSLKKAFPLKYRGINECDILIDGFDYSISRFPLAQKYIEKNSIPRGLFDVISIVSRYKGLIIIRSNYGKIIFDFSTNKTINDSVIKYDTSNTKFFNGTIITILIPENNIGIETKSIKPQYLIELSEKKLYYLNILEIQKQAINTINNNQNKGLLKKDIYNDTLNNLSTYLDSKQNENCCILIDFNGCHLDSRVSRKILHFLASDYRINEKTNAIILNPHDKDIIISIQLEILSAPEEKKIFVYHPIPCLLQNKSGIDIIWLGISENDAYQKLNQVLHSKIHDKRLSDFDNKESIHESGFFKLDEYGNIVSLIGDLDDLSIFHLVEKARIQKDNSIFLCSGNYYQYKYIALLEQLYDYDYSNFISNLLHKKNDDFKKVDFSEVTHILAITLSSQLLANAFISQLSEENKNRIKFIRLSNYHSFFLENEFIQGITADDKVVVICDVISTGYLITLLKQKLKIKRAILQGIISIFDTRKEQNLGSVPSHYESEVPTLSLKEIPIDKYRRNEVVNINQKTIIRINPATNSPITLDVNKSDIDGTIIMSCENFLLEIDFPENYIKIGYYEYNKLFHPYFFETHKLFKSQNGINLITKILFEIGKRIDLKIDYVFYPIFSGAEEIHNNEEYRDKAFNNKEIEFIPLGRFNTPHGWRFTFPPKLLNAKTLNSNVFIIDDGSCTGATIIQMIDEISFLEVKSINVLSLIGRIDDYLREFFSKIKTLKVRHINDVLLNTFKDSSTKDNNEVPLNIFFGSQWQIPTYPIGLNFPLYEENQLLSSLISLDSLPDFLHKYVSKRIEKIKLSNIRDNKELNYLPKDRKTNKIPIVELLITRNHLGKINGYRFYRDYFNYFNTFVNTYYEENENFSTNILRQTELILSVLLHEPYLIRSVQDFLPDVHEILLNFTQRVLDNEKLKDSFNFKSLELKWDKASFLSIYLNLRKENVQDVMNLHNFEIIIDFISNDSALNSLRMLFIYILYFVPITKLELQKQENGIFCLNAITTSVSLLSKKKVKPSIISNINIFKSFLNTIPYLDKELVNEKVCLIKLNQFFTNERDIRTHDSIEKQLGIIKSQSYSIKFATNSLSISEKIQNIKDAWAIILPRIEQLQRYTHRLVGIFQIYKNGIINDYLFNSNNNLFKICKEITDIIENDNIYSKGLIIHDYTKNILLPNFFAESAFIYKLFLDFKTSNIISVWDEVIGEKISGIEIENKSTEIDQINNLTIPIPLLFLKDIVFAELKRNFRYADIDNSIFISWQVKEKELILKISNKIGKKGKKGGRNGFQMFETLTHYFEFRFEKSISTDNNFVQKYNFKIE